MRLPIPIAPHFIRDLSIEAFDAICFNPKTMIPCRRHPFYGVDSLSESPEVKASTIVKPTAGRDKKPESIALTALWAVPAFAGPPPAACAIAGHSTYEIDAVKAAFSFSFKANVQDLASERQRREPASCG